MINLTLELFNAVPSKGSEGVTVDVDNGVIITTEASWATPQIKEYYKQNRLSGNDLNKTFHKSWSKILATSRLELLVEQITHYLSTYGSDFQEEVYIPDEVLNLENTKLTFKTVKGYTVAELTEKSLNLLRGGIALKQETIEKVLTLLSLLGYTFTTVVGIKNKEASVLISDKYGVYPEDALEALRYCIYKSTGESLLIKSKDIIGAIKSSKFDPSVVFDSVGLKEMSTIFNRFKPLFLAYKSTCGRVINKISKLSKKHHKGLVVNPLNVITSVELTKDDTHWLDNATPFMLFKVLNACRTRLKGQTNFVYRVRNGKSWTKQERSLSDNTKKVLESNFNFVLNYFSSKINLAGKKYYIPDFVKYTLPTSEKMFVGNIPTGSKFLGESLAVGVYWENSWGARDLDVSGMNVSGKIGWNATYSQEDQLLYSGDITNAPDGAVEYLYSQGLQIPPTIVQCNVYSGNSDCGYKIIVGTGDDVTKDCMMNPEKVMFEVKCNSIQKQMYLGLIQSTTDGNCFTLLNFGSGHTRIGGDSELSTISCKALVEQYNSTIHLNDLIVFLGGEIVDKVDDGVYNLSPEVLEKDTLINIFQ